MILVKFKLNFSWLVTVAIIVTEFSIFANSVHLPPRFSENVGKKSFKSVSRLSSSLITARSDDNYRLPNNTVPIHYDIEVTTNVHNGTRNFTGQVQILLTALEDTKTIVVHSVLLEDFKVTIKSANEPNAIKHEMHWSYESKRQFLSLTPHNKSLSFHKGSNWILTIAYKGTLGTETTGFYMTSYTDSLDKIRYIATTNFESIGARLAFPCYDEPAKRATFTITIKHDPSLSALSNMPKNETASSNGVTVFEKTRVTMPTYLVAFHVSDFEYTEGVLNSIPHRLYSRPAEVGNQEFGLVTGMQVLEHLAKYFNLPYDLPKMDQVAIPGMGGAMENWGMVTYGEDVLLFNKNSSTASDKLYIANYIAHEFTHQWLGDRVTARWFTYEWLNEGFAELLAYQAIDEIYPGWDFIQMLHTDEYEPALYEDGQGRVVPMTHYVQTPSEIKGRYDTSSYAKPACVIYMWQNALGNEVFRSSLNKYLVDNAYGSAEEKQLFAAMQSAVDKHKVSIPAPIDVMFSSWSQQSGFPLLTVTRNYTSQTFTVIQTPYSNGVTSTKTYYVPFNYASASKPDYRNTTASHYLLNNKQIIITDKDVKAEDWLILNKQATGYYRINYDNQNWHLIAEGLRDRPTKIHSRNRAQLLYDAYELVFVDRLDHSIMLHLLTYLPGEDKYAPWRAASSIIRTYQSYLSGVDDFKDLQTFFTLQVTDIYKSLGVNDMPGEQGLRKLIRNTVVSLACSAGVEACLTESNNKLKDFINNGIPIEPDVKQQAFCNGLRRSSDKEYNYFWNDLLKSSDTNYRSLLINQLGCSENETQLKRFISSLIDLSNSLTDSERVSIVNNIYPLSGRGLLVSIDFLSNNWEAYGKLTDNTDSSPQLSTDILDMSFYVNSKEQEKKLLSLVDKVKNSDMVDSELEENVKANMAFTFDWLDKNREPVMSFVKQYLDNGN